MLRCLGGDHAHLDLLRADFTQKSFPIQDICVSVERFDADSGDCSCGYFSRGGDRRSHCVCAFSSICDGGLWNAEQVKLAALTPDIVRVVECPRYMGQGCSRDSDLRSADGSITAPRDNQIYFRSLCGAPFVRHEPAEILEWAALLVDVLALSVYSVPMMWDFFGASDVPKTRLFLYFDPRCAEGGQSVVATDGSGTWYVESVEIDDYGLFTLRDGSHDSAIFSYAVPAPASPAAVTAPVPPVDALWACSLSKDWSARIRFAVPLAVPLGAPPMMNNKSMVIKSVPLEHYEEMEQEGEGVASVPCEIISCYSAGGCAPCTRDTDRTIASTPGDNYACGCMVRSEDEYIERYSLMCSIGEQFHAGDVVDCQAYYDPDGNDWLVNEMHKLTTQKISDIVAVVHGYKNYVEWKGGPSKFADEPPTQARAEEEHDANATEALGATMDLLAEDASNCRNFQDDVVAMVNASTKPVVEVAAKSLSAVLPQQFTPSLTRAELFEQLRAHEEQMGGPGLVENGSGGRSSTYKCQNGCGMTARISLKNMKGMETKMWQVTSHTGHVESCGAPIAHEIEETSATAPTVTVAATRESMYLGVEAIDRPSLVLKLREIDTKMENRGLKCSQDHTRGERHGYYVCKSGCGMHICIIKKSNMWQVAEHKSNCVHSASCSSKASASASNLSLNPVLVSIIQCFRARSNVDVRSVSRYVQWQMSYADACPKNGDRNQEIRRLCDAVFGRGTAKTAEMLRGVRGWVEAFTKIPGNGEAILTTKSDGKTFESLFVIFESSMRVAMTGGKRVVAVDGAFLELHGLRILVLEGITTNNTIFPIAFLICEVENIATLSYLFECIKETGRNGQCTTVHQVKFWGWLDNPLTTIVADRGPGKCMRGVVKKCFATDVDLILRSCLIHVIRALEVQFGHTRAKNPEVIAMSNCRTPEEVDACFQRLRVNDRQVYEYIVQTSDYKLWLPAYVDPSKPDCEIHSSNLVEQ